MPPVARMTMFAFFGATAFFCASAYGETPRVKTGNSVKPIRAQKQERRVWIGAGAFIESASGDRNADITPATGRTARQAGTAIAAACPSS